jgi:zinc transport system permease protein
MQSFYDGCRRLAEAGFLPASFRYEFMVRGLLAALLLSPILGGLSHIVVAKRLAFFSAALGNAALTGLTIGLALGESSGTGGVFGFCLLVAIAMVYVRRRSRISPDTLVGVFLALTLGLGICLLVAVTKRFNIHQIQAIMFGDILTVTDRDLLVLLGVGVLVGGVLLRFYNEILFGAVDEPLAQASGSRTALMEYLVVVLLTASIVASLKVIGALLVEALVVVPAAGAKNLARSMKGYLGWSVALATAGSVTGLLLSDAFPVPSGGAIVLALSGLFFLTFIVGKLLRRGT